MSQENAKVHQAQNPDTLTVESGGTINVKTGGAITANGTQASLIADALTAGSATAADCATKLNLVIAALKGIGAIASS